MGPHSVGACRRHPVVGVEDAVLEVKRLINKYFEVRDEADFKQFLGMQVLEDKETRTVTLANLHQTGDILKAFEMYGCNLNHTPMVGGTVRGGVRQLTLHKDNQAFIGIATNEAMSSRTKHVNVCYHLIRDCVEKQ